MKGCPVPLKAQQIKKRIVEKKAKDKRREIDKDKCRPCNGTGWLNAGAGRIGVWECYVCAGTGKRVTLLSKKALTEERKVRYKEFLASVLGKI